MGLPAIGLSAGAGVMGAVGSIMGGNAQAANDRYQAQVAMRNAQQAANNADVAQAQGTVQAQSAFQQGSQRMGAARAGFGASGVDVNSGSALGVQSAVARDTAMTVNNIGYNADVRAVGFRNQVSNEDTQANVDRTEAANATTAGYLGAATSLIGSASSVASKWDSFRNAGVLGGGGLTGTTSAGLTAIDGTKLAAAGGTDPWQAALLPTGS